MNEHPPASPLSRDPALNDYVNQWNIVLSLADALQKNDALFIPLLLKRIHLIETYTAYADKKFIADPRVFPKSTDATRIALLDTLANEFGAEFDAIKKGLLASDIRAIARIAEFAARFRAILPPLPPHLQKYEQKEAQN